MQYRNAVSRPCDIGVKGVSRGAAFVIDAALVVVVSFALEQEKFGGLPAVIFLLGVYRVVAHAAFKRTVGKAILKVTVDAHVRSGGRVGAREWWRLCLLRELPFYGLPGVILVGQPLLGFELNPAAEGWLLVVLVCTLGVELLLLAGDAAMASLSEDGRSLHDRLAGTTVRRSTSTG